MDNSHVISQFVKAINEAVPACDKIMHFLDDHCELAPEDVQIGHVYNVRHVNALLNEIQTFLGMQEV